MTMPALRELRRVLPGAHITLATRAWTEGIFADAGFLDDILILDQNARGLRALPQQVSAWRKRRFDLALFFPNSFGAVMMAAVARVPWRIGYATHSRRALLTHSLSPPAWRHQRHEVFYYLNIIAELERLLTGKSHVEEHEPCLDLHVSEARAHEAREILLRYGATLQRPLVAVCPGSTNSRAKRWPVERFASVCDRLIEKMEADIVLIGAREELNVTHQVVEQMRHHPVVLTGKTDLAQTVAMLSAVDLLITNDTGPAHIAAALNRPTLVIFGPTNPVTTRPFSRAAEVIRRPPDCAPCMLRDCPIDHRCMTAITPDEIFTRATALIRQGTNMEVAR